MVFSESCVTWKSHNNFKVTSLYNVLSLICCIQTLDVLLQLSQSRGKLL